MVHDMYDSDDGDVSMILFTNAILSQAGNLWIEKNEFMTSF